MRQTAGILILALGILCDEAYAKYNWGQENSSDSEQISDAERAQWGQLAMDAELRRVYVSDKSCPPSSSNGANTTIRLLRSNLTL